MASLQTGYQALLAYNDNEAETPQEGEVMIHVVPESGKSRWNHIEDLDSFFTRIYQYHQRHGFGCMVLYDVVQLITMVFLVCFPAYALQCINYKIIFNNGVGKNHTLIEKVTLYDALVPLDVCVSRFPTVLIILLSIALIVWIVRLIKAIYQFFQYYEIKVFYTTALKITSNELCNMTWHEVQHRILEVQREQQMCIHKRELSELDIYHRILRFKNYMVAMVNKNLLPVKFNIPFVGEIVFLSKDLKYNFEMIFFKGVCSPFENNWQLKEDYKRVAKRKHLARELSKHIAWIAVANFILSPVIFTWQLIRFCFDNAEIVKREPGFLATRRWSNYARLYCRHFNELDHEINARLNRAYKPAVKYMSSFASYMLETIGRMIITTAGTVVVFISLLALYDEDVFNVEHFLQIMVSSTVIVAIGRSLLPANNCVWCPEKLMTTVLAHIHYMPDHWKNNAHMEKVRVEFSQLFQYRASHIVEEVISPIVTPFVLFFYLRPRALDIVDFFRNFTVDVVGVGDVCSFAQMDVRQHGNPHWMSDGHTEANQYQQAEDGKTELSLMHFTVTNPNWVPPEPSSMYLKNLREKAVMDAGRTHVTPEENPLYYSLTSVSSMGEGYTNFVDSILHTLPNSSVAVSVLGCSHHSHRSSHHEPPHVVGGISDAEGPLHNSSTGLLSSLNTVQQQGEAFTMPHFQSLSTPLEQPIEFAAANMSVSVLYMHRLHSQHLRNASSIPRVGHPSVIWQRPLQDMPGIMESPNEAANEGEEREEHQPLLTDLRIVRSS